MPPTLSAGPIGAERAAVAPPMSVDTQPGWKATAVTPRTARSIDRLLITALSAALDEIFG